MPTLQVGVGGSHYEALVDSGCTVTVVSRQVARIAGLKVKRVSTSLKMLDGRTAKVLGEGSTNIALATGSRVSVNCLVVDQLVLGYPVVLGMDFISRVGGVVIDQEGVSVRMQDGGLGVQVGAAAAGGVMTEKAECLVVEDKDFTATFSGGAWVVSWKWKGEVPRLTNQCGQYTVKNSEREAYEAEIAAWIEEGWLVPYDREKHGEVDGVVPLMSVCQANKQGKVRPVMDYREVNDYVMCYPGVDAAVCGEKLRQWRKLGSQTSLLDLRKAYLQLHVSDDMVRFQAVRHQGQLYVMTRLGFGLNVAPKIMSRVLGKVLSLDATVAAGTDHYVDDIIVNESVVSVDKVKQHLTEYGLESKDPEPLDGARVLGLRVSQRNGDAVWQRDNVLPEVSADNCTRRELFSICGRLVGHYPRVGWLRVACAFVKREAGSIGWDERVPDHVRCMMEEMVERVRSDDPVRGRWEIPKTSSGRVWCDASSLAVGAMVEVGGVEAEDGSWLRKEGDVQHINVAELESVVRGLNLAAKWELTDIEIMSDSATVCGWLRAVIEDSHRPRTSGLSEMVMKRRLGTVGELIDVYGMKVTVTQVPSAANKADALTRVDKRWHRQAAAGIVTGMPCSDGPGVDELRDIHELNHFGVARTLYFARQRFGDSVRESDVRHVTESCSECRSIDPAPVRWEAGSLGVDKTWTRLSADIVHEKGVPYLSIVDCGPGRYAVWRKLDSERAASVITALTGVFSERGAPCELLTDNGPCFRSAELVPVLSKWGVCHLFSCVDRGSCNGIVERHHRTLKRMCARTKKSPHEMLIWYNNSPNDQGIVPSQSVFKYSHRLPGFGVDVAGIERVSEEPSNHTYAVGDEVYVRPRDARCTTVWPIRTVTGVGTGVSVEVNGRPRHIRDVRLARRCVDVESCRPVSPGRDRSEVVDDDDGVEVELSPLFSDETDGSGLASADGRQDSGGSQMAMSDSTNAEVVVDTYADVARRSVRVTHQPVWMRDYVN